MIQEIDYGKIILENVDQINRVCGDLEKSHANNTLKHEEVDASLVIITASMLRILNIIFPLTNHLKTRGLPEQAYNDKTPKPIFFDRENNDWDFKPWFQEKFSIAYEAFYAIMDEADGGSHILWDQLETLKTYNQAILDMLTSKRVVITDVVADDTDTGE